MPSTSAMLDTGMLPTDPNVAARTTKAAPATPAAPLDVSSSTASMVSWPPSPSGVSVACARNTTTVARYRQVPSRLNEYPVGTTRPTTVSSQPSARILRITCGSTVSVEVVAATITISSRMYPNSRHKLTPHHQLTAPKTAITNSAETPYNVRIRRPSATSEPVPKCPTVNAIEPNAPSGATHMTRPTIRKNTSRTPSMTSRTGLPRPPLAAS